MSSFPRVGSYLTSTLRCVLYGCVRKDVTDLQFSFFLAKLRRARRRARKYRYWILDLALIVCFVLLVVITLFSLDAFVACGFRYLVVLGDRLVSIFRLLSRITFGCGSCLRCCQNAVRGPENPLVTISLRVECCYPNGRGSALLCADYARSPLWSRCRNFGTMDEEIVTYHILFRKKSHLVRYGGTKEQLDPMNPDTSTSG